MNKLLLAIITSVTYHGEQLDKAGNLYIEHPLRVMLKFDNEIDKIAAVLHDTVEDTELTLEEIRTMFGDEVADTVDALSRREGETYKEFTERCALDKRARRIKLMDISDNMSPERYTESLAGIHKRYEKAKSYIISKMIEEGDCEDWQFCEKHNLIAFAEHKKFMVSVKD